MSQLADQGDDPLWLSMSGAIPSAGELIRNARHRTGLSQAELGRRAGVTQSVVGAYEAGARPGGRRVREHRSEIEQTAARHGASNMRVFGSVARRGQPGQVTSTGSWIWLPEPVCFGWVGCRENRALCSTPTLTLVPADDLQPGVAADALATRCRCESTPRHA
jgi:uncharacterized protein